MEQEPVEQKGEAKTVKSDSEFHWTIDDFFSSEKEPGACYMSDQFRFHDEYFYFMIYPKGESISYSNFMSLYLIGKMYKPPLKVIWTWSLKLNGIICVTKQEITYVFKKRKSKYGPRQLIQRSGILKLKSKLKPSDSLTIICNMKCSNSDCDEIIPKTELAPVDLIQCDICCARNKTTAFFPCCHFGTCSECSEQIETICPYCRATITTRKVLFLT